jgi:L-amino acid N-acyltransferase YncA
MLKIRQAFDGDIPAVTAIYAHHVLHGTGTFETDPPTAAEMALRQADVLSKGLPYLVIENASEILGFAYCNWFKPRPAYRFSAEDSIYMLPQTAKQGLGRMLLAELIAQAERAGVRKLIAVIGDSENQGSIGVHRACGFQHVGILSACGWKFERWLDAVLMERAIGASDSTTPIATQP